jgi:hypothetical protein
MRPCVGVAFRDGYNFFGYFSPYSSNVCVTTLLRLNPTACAGRYWRIHVKICEMWRYRSAQVEDSDRFLHPVAGSLVPHISNERPAFIFKGWDSLDVSMLQFLLMVADVCPSSNITNKMTFQKLGLCRLVKVGELPAEPTDWDQLKGSDSRIVARGP